MTERSLSPVSGHGDWYVLSPAGTLDLATGPALAVQVRQLVWNGARAVCIDLDGVGFIDSTGLAALLNAQRCLDRVDGRLALVAPPDSRVAKSLRVLGTPAALHVAACVEDAVAAAG